MSTTTALVVAALLLVGNAFFVGAEFALISARRTQVEPRVAAGSRAARTTLRAMEQVTVVMAGAQLGITACSLGLGAVAEPALAHLLVPAFHAAGVSERLLHPVGFVLALSLVTYLHVVVGEMVPKNIALAGPERAALTLGPAIMVVVTVLRPVVATLNAVANGLVRLARVQPREEVASAFSRDEVAEMVRESREEGLIGHEEYARLEGALGFTERSVTAVLLRPEALVTVPADASVGAVEEACARTGYSRFPVTSADGDLTGYLHVKDVLQTDASGSDLPLQGKWVRRFATVRPGDRLHDALAALRRRGAHMGRVVADDGRVLGVVTLEDVLEELVGEIRDAAHPRAGS